MTMFIPAKEGLGGANESHELAIQRIDDTGVEAAAHGKDRHGPVQRRA